MKSLFQLRRIIDHPTIDGAESSALNMRQNPIDHAIVLDMLKETIKDQRLIRTIARMFKAGVLAEGDLQISGEGVPQGSGCSPVLANIFAHYIIDDWFTKVVKPHCKGRVELFRYCDDLVICCQYERDAQRINKAIKGRLNTFKLRLNEKKTKSVSFVRPTRYRNTRPGTFDFLGMTFYWGSSRKGASIPKVKTIGKRLSSKLKKVSQWGRAVRNRYPLRIIWERFSQKVEGHIRYYGISHNLHEVNRFRYEANR